MVRTSVLDLGSNSFHVLVADAAPDGSVQPLLREREMLHLGTVVAEHGGIPDAERRRAVDVVAHLTELARRAGAEERLAVATSALRDADNGAEVIADMEAAAGTAIRVLDGLAEARLAYLGARASIATDDEPVLVLDLGGGSLELAVGRGARVVWAASTDLGVSRLSPLLSEDPPTSAGLQRIAACVEAELEPIASTLAEHDPARVVAVGGTVRALARVIAAAEHAWLPATLNRLELSAEQIAAARDLLTSLDLAGRLDVEGMKSRRADRIHIAAEVIHRVVGRLGVRRLEVSDWGLREGTILDALGVRSFPPASAMRRSAIDRVRQTFVPDDPHLPHVAELAVRVFDATRAVHGLSDEDREVLEHAALVHDVGESLALRRHHVHGAYLVENSEVRGHAPGELAMITTLVRFHKSRGVSHGYPPFAAMSAERRERTTRLLPLLQLADGLDRARDQGVRDLDAEIADDVVRLRLWGEGLHVVRAELDRKTDLFHRTFGLRVEVVDG